MRQADRTGHPVTGSGAPGLLTRDREHTPKSGTAGVPRPGAHRRQVKHGRPVRRSRQWAVLWLLSPAGLVMAAFSVAPILFLVFTSFTDYNQRTLFTGEFAMVGTQQYADMFADPEFWSSLTRSVVFTVAMVAGSVAVGVGVAQMLTRLGTALRMTVTVALIFAWAMPNVASSLVWKWLFQPGYGVVNWLLTQTHLFGDMTNTDWGEDASLAYLSIWLLVVWQAVPFIALTLYAALTQMPMELSEAARLDGAGEWRVWWSVTLPFLRPSLLLVTLMSVIWDFNIFNQIWLVSEGGPDAATTTLGIFAYKTAFVSFRIGQGAALSVLTTAILLGITAVYIRNLLRSGEDL
ncbi:MULTISPECIES: sugar ABC transporter permease [unclassified Streptomyces]|uniref:carbohydrate ABC transporter permease n=1 Tax=unclassified Streptomyces TaxID=2593676 RepID=UPI002E2E6639|nr:sugar ABC transporter permease [Streptomyces sp. NBC_01423]WSX89092.1 sugar ABC transporter permease [Streptomyces sp. NBC_00891]WSY03571.1 sugar ABC transporter permease [Streptomyces sp. NBC_00890]WSZ05198.1 sugar ABC transporter permease [Streptomyces sp. NBC_00869]WSZ27307.1 sugar ABC transporter permease [Streptomyces sp. NBC_00870]